MFQGASCVFPGDPCAFQGAPRVFQVAPCVFQGAPCVFQGAPFVFQSAPCVFQGAHFVFQDAPCVFQGAPFVFQDAPRVYQVLLSVSLGFQGCSPCFSGFPCNFLVFQVFPVVRLFSVCGGSVFQDFLSLCVYGFFVFKLVFLVLTVAEGCFRESIAF